MGRVQQQVPFSSLPMGVVSLSPPGSSLPGEGELGDTVIVQSLTFVVVPFQPLGTCNKPGRVSGIPSALPRLQHPLELPGSGEGRMG